jgi:ribosomal protein S17E
MKRISQNKMNKAAEDAIEKFNSNDRSIISRIIDISPDEDEIKSIFSQMKNIKDEKVIEEYARQIRIKYEKNNKKVAELVSKLSYDARMIFMGISNKPLEDIKKQLLQNAKK